MSPLRWRGFVPLGVALALLPAGVAPADEKSKSLPSVRFPFGEEQAKNIQDDDAKAMELPKEVTNSIGMKLVLIPPGSIRSRWVIPDTPNDERYCPIPRPRTGSPRFASGARWVS